MNDTAQTPTPSPAEAARQQWEAAGRPRRRWIAFVLVAVLSLAAGVGATLLALRWTAAQPTAAAATPSADQSAHGAGGAATATSGTTEAGVYISAARQQMIGVRTAEVTHRALDTTIRTVGVVAFDETRVAEIHPKIAGWIERMSVDFVGKPVRRGQPLLTIYSPDLVATQKEYLLALKARRQLEKSAFAETREGAGSLLAATRERLRLWDVTDSQIAELERTGEPRRTMTIYSPFTGIVLERSAYPGQYIGPEDATVKIADLSTIWVIAQFFEYELPMVKIGQTATIQFPYGQSSKTLTGRITFIYPDIDPQTRRVKVRVEFRNPGLEFKPESYVTVLVQASGGFELAIPKEAVIDTGARQYALLAKPNGYFEPREIQVGQPVDDYYPVKSGLSHGDVVVTSAQFLIDSETNLQEAMKSMVGHGHVMESGETMEGPPMAPAKPGAGHEGHTTAPPAPSPHEKHAAPGGVKK